MKVNNESCIRRVSLNLFRTAGSRNAIAMLAIVLTTLLFTSLFTITQSINESIQQQNFRQVGADFHGAFKNVTEDQMTELRADPLITESGGRLFLGVAAGSPFDSVHVEVSYMEDSCALHSFSEPEYGRLPREADELATDTRVLSLLGIEPQIGAQVHLPFYIDYNTVSRTLVDRVYTLSGWWEADEGLPCSFVNLSRSAAEEIAALSDGSARTETGTWTLNVMFHSSLGIEEHLKEILADHGYQCTNTGSDNYIDIGVNWAYTGTSMLVDTTTLSAIAVIAFLIIITGYLIIYNVFQISVSSDIRSYGLLKTIGTTTRQLERIILHQALILSALGIPPGLLLGWLVGVVLTPGIVSQLHGTVLTVSANPVIFLCSAVFALFTVIISCHRPGRMAGRVSPIEAVRYTETDGGSAKFRKGNFVSPLSMALANLGRNKSRTVITILSLSLAVLLLNVTFTFASSFDMDRFLSMFAASDFMVGSSNYFQSSLWNDSCAVPEDLIGLIKSQNGFLSGGRTYLDLTSVQEFVEEDYFRQQSKSLQTDTDSLNLQHLERTADGRLPASAQLYGMERFCLDKIYVLEGDITKLYEPGGRYVAAVYSGDVPGRANPSTHWASLGEQITLRYGKGLEMYNPDTGEIYPPGNFPSDPNAPWKIRPVEYTDVEYEVTALVMLPYCLSSRRSNDDQFILNDQTLMQDTGGECSVLYYAFDMADPAARDRMENFLTDYTTNVDSRFAFENKNHMEKAFVDAHDQFLILGVTLFFIVSLVGVLNFLNAILTGILTRRREFAMLQAVGMTSRQLKKMLSYEGIAYALISGALSLTMALVLNPLFKNLTEKFFWFLSFRGTVRPVLAVTPVFLLIGTLMPLIVYRFAADRSVIERLRTAAD